MNERIRELIDRAEHQAKQQSGSDWEVHVEPSRALVFEKFAELIVADCLSVAIEQKTWVENQQVFDRRDIDWNKARIQQSDLIVVKIKQHFGVEE